MSIRSGGFRARWLLAAGAAIVALSASGCSSVADLGTPADAPAHASDGSAYPAVHDVPTQREQGVLDAAQQAKIEAELSAARDHQASIAAAEAAAAAARAAQPAK